MTLLTRTIAFIGFSLTANSALAIEYTSVLQDKSTLTFTSRQMGVPVHGRFSKFTARITFDPARPESAKAEITVDLASIDAGSKDANDEVVGKQWFNVKMFPTATFSSTNIKTVGVARYEVTGPLIIKGRSAPVVAAFSFKSEGTNAVFDGAFTLKRVDFTVGEGAWADISTVANEVQVNFRLVAAPSVASPAKSK